MSHYQILLYFIYMYNKKDKQSYLNGDQCCVQCSYHEIEQIKQQAFDNRNIILAVFFILWFRDVFQYKEWPSTGGPFQCNCMASTGFLILSMLKKRHSHPTFFTIFLCWVLILNFVAQLCCVCKRNLLWNFLLNGLFTHI